MSQVVIIRAHFIFLHKLKKKLKTSVYEAEIFQRRLLNYLSENTREFQFS